MPMAATNVRLELQLFLKIFPNISWNVNHPNAVCSFQIKLACVCGHLTATTFCSQSESEYRRIPTALLASKMLNLQQAAGSGSIELNDLWPQSFSKNGSSKKPMLECNEECAKLERNRRLALALQVSSLNTSLS